LSDDVFGVYYNPAGLGFVRTAQLGADFGKLHMGLDDNSNLTSGFVAAAFPLKRVYSDTGVLSSSSWTVVSPAISSSTPHEVYHYIGTVATGWKYFTLADTYQESAYYLSFGRMLNERIAYGASVKYLMEKYVISDYLKLSPVFGYGQKDSVASVSVDAGVLYNIAPRLFVGASVLDVNQPNVGLYSEDRLPFTARLGVAWKDKTLSWAMDTINRNKQWYCSTGFERFLTSLFGIRMGLSYGGRNYFTIAGGFSINFYRMQLDYVFQYPISGLRDISGTHRMSFLFRFGRKQRNELEAGSLEYYYAKVQDELADVKQQLKDTKTEKENLEKVLIDEATLRIRERIKVAKNEGKGGTGTTVAASSRDDVREARDTRHIVRKGDTLQSVAARYLGDERRWNEIYQANKDSIGRGGELKPNQVLIIPLGSKTEVVEQKEKAVVVPVKETAAPVTVLSPFAAAQSAASTAATVVKTEDVPIKIIAIKSDAMPAATTSSEEAKVPSADQKPAGPEVRKSIFAEAAGVAAAPVVASTPASGAKKPAHSTASAAAPAPAAPKPKPAPPKKHVVQQGESLRSIAQKYYNDSNRWKDIYKANKDKVISGRVSPGQELLIPQ
jgi:nucleoid-associated protein YgaU